MKLKLVVIASFLAAFSIFVTLLSGNSEQINNVKNQEILEVINTEENTPDKVTQPKVKEEPIVLPETKTEEKNSEEEVIYTFNYSEESVKNRTYKVRHDGFIPIYNELFTLKKPNHLALFGHEVGRFDVSLNEEMLSSDFSEFLENNIGLKFQIYNPIGLLAKDEISDFFIIKAPISDLTPEKNEEVQNLISTLSNIKTVSKSNVILPEYDSIKYHTYLYSLFEE